MQTEDRDALINGGMCSHLQRKLLDSDGTYRRIWTALKDDPDLTAVVRSRQLHIYRNGRKVLVLAGKSQPKKFGEDILHGYLEESIQ